MSPVQLATAAIAAGPRKEADLSVMLKREKKRASWPCGMGVSCVPGGRGRAYVGDKIDEDGAGEGIVRSIQLRESVPFCSRSLSARGLTNPNQIAQRYISVLDLNPTYGETNPTNPHAHMPNPIATQMRILWTPSNAYFRWMAGVKVAERTAVSCIVRPTRITCPGDMASDVLAKRMETARVVLNAVKTESG
jgi:hypothetical protein